MKSLINPASTHTHQQFGQIPAGVPNTQEPGQAKPLKSAKHYAWLDGLRVFAIADIVGKHSIGEESVYYRDGFVGIVSPQHPFSGFGLPVFILCTIALTAKRSEPRPFQQMVRRKFSRLLLPWLFWSVFYILFSLRRAKLRGESLVDLYSIEELLFFGGTLGLWYLMFAFVAETLVNAVQHATSDLEHRWPKAMIGSWLALGALLLSAAPYLMTYDEEQSWLWYVQHTWIVGMMLIPVGLGLGLLLREYAANLAMRICLYAVGLLFILLSLINLHVLDAKFHALVWHQRTGLALILIAAALSIKSRMPKPLVFLGTYTFTIYLIHFFFIGQFENRITGFIGEDNPWLFFACVWLLSLIAAIVIKKLPVIKRLC